MKRINLSCIRYAAIAAGSSLWGVTKEDWIFIISVLIAVLSLIMDYLKIREHQPSVRFKDV